ncbi:hypothetical protein F2Q70_00006061 [Brassica cretica]|uniref:Uncharacterized protein n=1 Tax=Brassica cretica TaxID=69181 RepID=A0A8S9IUT2_BRACR|nr:hypothetical protein F2Q68_00022691 [Brassica cretica]KAF2573731.1 hypothetical protein F2Q70_00006061 [Brassica cretica]
MRCQSCEIKIEEKRHEADSLLTKLKELEDDDENLKTEQEACLAVHVLTRDTSV